MATPTTRFVTASNKSSHLRLNTVFGIQERRKAIKVEKEVSPHRPVFSESAMGSPPTKAAMVELLVRRTSYGQDTFQLYEREGSGKRWRAEHPATVEDKKEAKERLQRFRAAVGSMENLKLDITVEQHVQSLVDRFIQSGVCGDGRARAALKQRLERVRAAAITRRSMRLVHNSQFVILDCQDYLTYVRDEEPGTRTKMVTKPRMHPYEVGCARGHARITRTQAARRATGVCHRADPRLDP